MARLLLQLGPLPIEVPLVMDRAYEGDEARQLVPGFEHDSDGSTQIQPTRTLGLRSRTLHETQPSGAPVPTVERLPLHFSSFEKRCVSGLHLLCIYHRGSAIVEQALASVCSIAPSLARFPSLRIFPHATNSQLPETLVPDSCRGNTCYIPR